MLQPMRQCNAIFHLALTRDLQLFQIVEHFTLRAARFETQGRTEPGQHGGIDTVRFCKLADRFRKPSCLARIDLDHRDASRRKRLLQKPMIWSGRLEYDPHRPRCPMETMVACDFFSKTVFTLRGPRTAYVLIFIHLGSRRVFCSAPTYAPDSAWVTQQARNTLMWCAEQGITPEFLIRDADTKLSASFDAVWASEAARVIQIPHRAPDANAFAESFIGTIKRECLDFFVCFSRSQLDFILRTWVRHYNFERLHRGRDIGNNVLKVDFQPIRDGPTRATISLRRRLRWRAIFILQRSLRISSRCSLLGCSIPPSGSAEFALPATEGSEIEAGVSN